MSMLGIRLTDDGVVSGRRRSCADRFEAGLTRACGSQPTAVTCRCLILRNGRKRRVVAATNFGSHISEVGRGQKTRGAECDSPRVQVGQPFEQLSPLVRIGQTVAVGDSTVILQDRG